MTQPDFSPVNMPDMDFLWRTAIRGSACPFATGAEAFANGAEAFAAAFATGAEAFATGAEAFLRC